MKKQLIGAIAAIVGFSATVQAATLLGVSGQVLVNRGSGFEVAQQGMDLKPGDIVVVNPGSAAHIVYPEGCAMPVAPGMIASIAAKAPCAPLTTGSPAVLVPALTGSGLLLGGAGIAGGGAAAYALSKKSASP